jgi:hypothetical protein
MNRQQADANLAEQIKLLDQTVSTLRQLAELLYPQAQAIYCGQPPVVEPEPLDINKLCNDALGRIYTVIDQRTQMHKSELHYAFANQKILEARRWDELFKELRPTQQPRVEVRLYGGGGAGGSAGYNPFAPITGAGGSGGSSSFTANGGSGRFITTNFNHNADASYYAIATANDSRGPIHAAVPVFNPAHSYQVGDKVLIDGKLHEVTQAHGGVYNYNRVETDAFGNQTVVSRGTATKSQEPQVETPSSAPIEHDFGSWDYDSTFGDN